MHQVSAAGEREHALGSGGWLRLTTQSMFPDRALAPRLQTRPVQDLRATAPDLTGTDQRLQRLGDMSEGRGRLGLATSAAPVARGCRPVFATYQHKEGVLMTNRRTPVARLVVLAAIVATIGFLVFSFYPRDLKRVAGLHGVTPADIVQIQLSMSIYREPESAGMVPRTELIASNEVITDEGFFEQVLQLLDEKRIRTRPFSSGMEYRKADFSKPAFTLLSMSLEHGETVFISISNDSRFVAMWSSETEYARYRLYGEGIDTRQLRDAVPRPNSAPGG